VAGDELARGGQPGAHAGQPGAHGEQTGTAQQDGAGGLTPAGRALRRARSWRLPSAGPLWLSVFGVSLGAFLIRFLVPVPVAQADNRDGPRLLCGLNLSPVTGGHPRFFRFAYFDYVSAPRICHGRLPYPSSELVPLVVARLLTPVFGLRGDLNMIALGVLMCMLASVGIASLATGLRIPLWGKLLVAAATWLIVADAAFFDVDAGPFSEPAALIGLLLVAAGAVYLGRGGRAGVFGIVLAGAGGFLAILSKEQYLLLAIPVCLTLVLATARLGRWRRLERFRTPQALGAAAVAGALAALTAGYLAWDYLSHYGRRLHYIQAVDMIFTDIVTRRSTAPAALRALHLPVSWAKYAGRYYWARGSVRTNPLFHRYTGQLGDGNIARYLLTHPAAAATIGQNAAKQAQAFRVTTLGDYPAYAGHPPGTTESRVAVVTWLMHQLPAGLGLGLYLPLWAAMAVVAIVSLRLTRGRPWRRDGAAVVLCMTGCAVVAFVPPAYFAGISTTRHMVGANLATLLALVVSVALAGSLAAGGLVRWRDRRAAAGERWRPVSARAGSGSASS
jgi:hypothetical protein